MNRSALPSEGTSVTSRCYERRNPANVNTPECIEMEGLESLISGQVVNNKTPAKKQGIDPKITAKKDKSVDPMVILVHMLRRYVTEVKGKSNYVANNFLEKIRSKIGTSAEGQTTKMPQFYGLLSVLSKAHQTMLEDISQSPKIRHNERRVVTRIKTFQGAEEEMQSILKMLRDVKKDEIYRKEINHLIKYMEMGSPISTRIQKNFSAYVAQLQNTTAHLEKIIEHVFEKVAESDRMTQLLATIFMAIDNEKFEKSFPNIIKRLKSVTGCESAFAKSFATIFAATDQTEKAGLYFKRISEALKADFDAKTFIRFYKQLPLNKLKAENTPLLAIFKALAAKSTDFLFDLTHHIFIEAKKFSLSNVPLELMHRGLIAVFDYTPKRANFYVDKLIESVDYYYHHHHQEKDQNRSHFFLLLAALSKYCQSLLDEIIQQNIFRENETDTLMPVIVAVKDFHMEEDQPAALDKVWNMLQPIHQKKETRDELTRIHQLTADVSPAYSKDFVYYTIELLGDEEQFSTISAYILEQLQLDPVKNEAAVKWHSELLCNIFKYLGDSAVLVNAEFRPLLGRLIARWIEFNSMFMYVVFCSLRPSSSSCLRDLSEYLYSYTPRNLVDLIEYLVFLADEELKDETAVCVQLIHMALLERSHTPGMSPNDTADRIENVKKLFEEITNGMGDEYRHRVSEVFSISYLQSIQHLTQVANVSSTEIMDADMVTDIPGSVISLINQSAKTFNIQNFANRALTNLSEIVAWSLNIAEKEISSSMETLEKIAEFYKHFANHHKFPRHTNASITHNFAYKNEFDYFSFSILIYIIAKKLNWEDLYFRTSWRDITVTTSTGITDLEIKNNTLITSKSLFKTRERFYNEVRRVMKPLKGEQSVEMFFHIKNGTALCDNRRFRLASISFDKAIEINNTNFFSHYWKAFALKKARINFEQYERHIEIARRYHPNSVEIEELMNTQY